MGGVRTCAFVMLASAILRELKEVRMMPLVHIFFSGFFLLELTMSEGTGKITLMSQFTENIRYEIPLYTPHNFL